MDPQGWLESQVLISDGAGQQTLSKGGRRGGVLQQLLSYWLLSECLPIFIDSEPQFDIDPISINRYCPSASEVPTPWVGAFPWEESNKEMHTQGGPGGPNSICSILFWRWQAGLQDWREGELWRQARGLPFARSSGSSVTDSRTADRKSPPLTRRNPTSLQEMRLINLQTLFKGKPGI